MGIILDERLLSFPRLITTISDSGRITGDFTKEEVDFLVRILRSGKLPAKLRKESLKQRARAAKQGKSPTDLAGGKAFDKFDQLESRIDAMEEMQELTESMEARDLATEAKFSKLDQKNPEIEDELAELKRRMEEGE